MKDNDFYLRLGDIWNDLNTFWQRLTIPTHSQKSISDLAENLLRVKINSFINDWLVVAYVPDSKNIESPRLRSPSGDTEKKIYDYLIEAIHILSHWWRHKKELDQWSDTEKKLRPICDELKKICSETNRQPIQTTGVVAGLRKVAELLENAGPGHYTIRRAKDIGWDLSEVFSYIALDVVNYGKGLSKSCEKEFLTHKEADMKALVIDTLAILDSVENMPPDKADESASALRCLADELEKLNDAKVAKIETSKEATEASGGSESDNIQETSKTTKQKVEAIRAQVFICYSHKDDRWLSDLQKHLKPYLRDGSITAWSDKHIIPGSKWFSEIEKALALTKVAVLLVTPDFLASDFINKHELSPLLKEAEKGGVRILWIPVRACSYKKTPLKDYQAVIDPDKPLVNFRLNRDKTWVRICEEIEKAVKS